MRFLGHFLHHCLAALYVVMTKVLVQSIKRNIERVPVDFMFQLSFEDFANLRSQTVTSSSGYSGRRYAPYAFTEQGIWVIKDVANAVNF
jgi:ORF6N domain